MLTEAGQLVGTIPYMSPEQIAGNIDQLDTRSDVHTGVILYELLTGRRRTRSPARRSSRPLSCHQQRPRHAVGRDQPISLRAKLQTVVSKGDGACDVRRYQSAAELAADITRYLRF